MGTPGSRFNYLTAPLVTLTPFGNLEIVTHVPRDTQTAEAFHQMALEMPSKVYRLSSWPEKTTH